MTNNNPLPSKYYIAPSNLSNIVDNIYQYAVLHYLLQLSNNSDRNPNASFKTLSQGLMGESMAKRSIKALQDKGFITHKKHGWQSNEYIIHREVIFKALDESGMEKPNNKVQDTRLKSKYSENQLDIMAEKRATKKPIIAHRAEFKNGFDVSQNGKPINNEVTKLYSKYLMDRS